MNLIIMSVFNDAILFQSLIFIVTLITLQANNDITLSFSLMKSIHFNAFDSFYLLSTLEISLSIQKTIMFNDVIIFDDIFAYARLFTIVKSFFKI